MSRGRLLLLAALAAAAVAFFALGGHRYLTFENIKAQQDALRAAYERAPLATAAAFFAIYVAVTGISLPGAALMTLVAGALFGLLWGTVIVSFASALGATAAFLAARFVLRDWVRARFPAAAARVDDGVRREGAFYLFTLRLIPAVPFFVINLAMGLTAMRVRTFYWVSQLGMLAGTLVYVNAGTQLAGIASARDIVSPGLLGALALLGAFPLLAKKALDGVKAKRVYAGWQRPRRFDRNLVVIGAGSAGLVAAYIAAAVRAKVTLVEKRRMGGDCLNTGCVPSKALIRTARLLAQLRDAPRYGIRRASVEFDFAEAMERVQRVIRAIEPHDSVARYTALGVECLRGEARIASPWSVEVSTEDGVRTLTTRSIVIAAGARPLVPPLEGIDRIELLTSDNVWELRELPRRLAVLGGGPIGCELAQAFARLGAQVTLVEMLPRLLPREDPEFSDMVRSRFAAEGIDVRTGYKALRIDAGAALRIDAGAEHALVCEHEGREVRVPFDKLLCALGRVANTEGYGLEALGIPLTKGRTIETNEFLQTRFPNIYACGDVAGPYQFTHTASHQAWYAAVNALFGGFRRFRADYSVIPWATFTDPEVARVGLNEVEAKARGVPYEVTTYDLDELDRAIADGAAHGRVKVLTAPGKDRILGATIAGEHAGELIGEFVTAMKHGLGMNKILGTIHVYPTFLEANKYAAGAWKRAHAPQAVLDRLERLHAWLRG
ncbi:MAG TPA: FAD-dependent oxidoreductase [Burkholderiales bacterium]|nr:FAD-dependent oxidoreductase [Burkholderiales bacterium]